nr:HAMP domain-containing protein [Methylomarinum sp. Ch1-1]MDP4519359.1 HAMP domain-containing protein [Methylomarinum sp. Ch1-1]
MLKKTLKKIGSVEIGLGLDNIKRAQQRFLLNSLTIISACFIFATLFALRLGKVISSPIINLTEVADDLANGNMDARAKKTGTTEIATLCDSFNAMAIGLQQTQNYLLQQVDNAVKELTLAMQTLEEKISRWKKPLNWLSPKTKPNRSFSPISAMKFAHR